MNQTTAKQAPKPSPKQAPRKASGRQALSAKIHIAVKDLNMPDEAYRDILQARFGVASSARLSVAQLQDLLKHFAGLGWAPKKKRPAPRAGIEKLCKRIWAQCYSLKRPVPAYADGLAKRMYGVEKLIWCDAAQLHAITTALGLQQTREDAPTAPYAHAHAHDEVQA
ncbi:hypothetical protein DGI_0928 [Megalodesulfovibrio gigas DSM 1382 = ATCC 19364]|uniref:Mu-like prophage protein gp16 n=1 Tax=Megalodesulfovibrio gigas (strain ATCC 19364 / DSM 1382 / NCIMB 9332 / VKM B-1759) TaxID=1121448 RepID=T2G9L1_MEGG1|nr:hypothetical protein DGI_0928 [Megalodesulfovibrio gigas DSM 1382 = ATCC 19364]